MKKANQFLKKTLLMSLILVLIACGSVKKFTWQKISYDDSAVWAEDASEIAVMRLSFEEKQGSPLNGTTNKRNFQHQFFAQNGQGRHPITGILPHQAGQFFYMKQAQYLLVESLVGDTGSYFEKINLKTAQVQRVLTIPPLHQHLCNVGVTAPPIAGVPFKMPSALAYSAIPSPTGKYIVTGFSSVCGQADIKIHLAENLVLVQQYSLKIPEAVGLIWLADSHLVVAGSKNAWKIDPSKATVSPTTIPSCSSPKTSSSEITVDHRLLVREQNGFKVVNSPSTVAFGCK